ncbi:MAG: DNA-directed RNA polymerase subunit G [Sulfolobales archaeon]
MPTISILEDQVIVKNIRKSLVPKILIVDLEGSKSSVTMDLHKEVFIVKEGETLNLVMGKELPQYKDGVDFCARGVVAGIKKDERGERLIISLWGFLVILTPKDQSIIENLSPTDQIYFCLRRIST